MRGEVGGRWRCRGTSLNQIFSCRLDGPHAAEVSVRLDVRPLFLGGPVTRARRVEADRLRAHAASTRECGEQSVEVDDVHEVRHMARREFQAQSRHRLNPETSNRTSIIQTTWRALRTLRGLNAVRHSGHKTCPFTIVLWTCVVTHRTQNFVFERPLRSEVCVCVWRV